MTYVVTDQCIDCGLCIDECPASAIKQVTGQVVIHPDACTDSGDCVSVCPVDDAIFKLERLPKDKHAAIAFNAEQTST